MFNRKAILQSLPKCLFSKVSRPGFISQTYTGKFPIWNSYLIKPYYYFSNGSNHKSKNNDVNMIKQFYHQHGWGDKFFNKYYQLLDKYKSTNDWQSLKQINDTLLQQIKLKRGVNTPQYVTILYFWICYAQKNSTYDILQGRIHLLYEILIKNPTISRQLYQENSSFLLQNEVALVLKRTSNIHRAIKLLEFLIHKYIDFDQTKQIKDQTRLETYFILTECYIQVNNNKQLLQVSRKAFNLIQKGTKKQNPQDEFFIIYNYAASEIKYGSKQKSIRAFDLLEKYINWNDPHKLLMVLHTCSIYFQGGLNQRGAALFDKFEKVCQQKKDQIAYKRIYESSEVTRIEMLLALDQYEKLNQTIKNIMKSSISKMRDQVKLHYHLLNVLCQYKLNKKENVESSLLKAHSIARSLKPSNLLSGVLAQLKIIQQKFNKEMIPKDKQIFDEIKKIVGDAFNKISKS